jgi:SPX domain protein involved in polyphosphate accumulation
MSFNSIEPNIPPPITIVLEIPKYKEAFLGIQEFSASLRKKYEFSLQDFDLYCRTLDKNIFGQQLSEQIKKINIFCRNQYNGFGEKLNDISRRMMHLLSQPLFEAVQNKKTLESELDFIVDDVINLEHFVTLVSLHLMKTVKLYVKDEIII